MNENEFVMNDEGAYGIIQAHTEHAQRTTLIIDKGGEMLNENLKQLSKEMGLNMEVFKEKDDKENSKKNPIQEVDDMQK